MTTLSAAFLRAFAPERIKCFVSCQRGAVTIDWVAVSAGILLLAVALVYGIFTGGVGDLSGYINTTLTDAGQVADRDPTPSQGTFR